MRQLTYRHTLAASYVGYVTQAIVNNLPPLLFIVFQKNLGLDIGQLTFLIMLNFGVQLVTDALSPLFIDKIGYKKAIVLAHILGTAGLFSMGILPGILPSAYAGLAIAMVVNAIGGGLIEVLVSPIVEALPGDKKSAEMSLLHSFYCWGHVAVVLISTLFFTVSGLSNWMLLCFIWGLVPLFNCFLFAKAPVKHLIEEGDTAVPVRKLFTKKIFLLLMVAMVCAGASEQAMSQWASLFAESGLGVSKTMGDLLGPCVFAVLMGTSRLVLGTGKFKIKLETLLLASSVLCVFSYTLTVFAPIPIVSLVGCGLAGMAVGCMWPTVFSLAAKVIPKGGTAMFALFALAGDLGCAGGPGLVGIISDLGEGWLGFTGDETLKVGIFFAIAFPVVLLVSVMAIKQYRKKEQREDAECGIAQEQGADA
ncbi:MFS transporter [Christensenellaceae bacterium OttesenSCG-928-K19]|nr:MFS transporter [Christensenellaceae bacterium OttesenSCG-928-K19]